MKRKYFFNIILLTNLAFFLLFKNLSVFASENNINQDSALNNIENNLNINNLKEDVFAGQEKILNLKSLTVKIPATALNNQATLQLEDLGTDFPLPWNYQLLDRVYQLDFADTSKYYNRKEFLEITIDYGEFNNYYKQIFFFDGSLLKWRPLPSVDDPKNHKISAKINFPFARIAVLYNDQILTVGQVSWYRFKGGLYAASPDFQKGTVLKVTNLDNNKSVLVTVNDYGPDRLLFPKRVLDLDVVAFKKIASLNTGIINVKIEPQKIVVADKDKIEAGTNNLEINSLAAVVIKESDGSILYNKNATKVLPLASLTKLIAVKVFLDTRPDLNKVVSYSVQDENYNYQYVKPWESARLTVKDGDTLTVGDLLYSALVGSANNAIESLVRVSGLERSEFIKRMNDQVKSWGANNTHFIEPTGLSPENVSSPLDYAIIVKEIFKNPLLSKISTTPRYSFSTINTKIKHNLKNTNNSLLTKNYKIIGSKTGYLDEAGYCLMTRVESPVGPLVVVNFGAKTKADSLKDNDLLIKYSFKKISQ